MARRTRQVGGGRGLFLQLDPGFDRGREGGLKFCRRKPFSANGVSVIEVDDGRISRNLDYYDAATIMRQVDVLPEQKK
jgi:hypothetical protein